MQAIDWQAVWVPTMSLLEVVVRGSVVYLGLVAAMRVSRREGGSLNTADLLMIVLVANAVQNAMSSTYNSVTEGAALVGTILFWTCSRLAVVPQSTLSAVDAGRATPARGERPTATEQHACGLALGVRSPGAAP